MLSEADRAIRSIKESGLIRQVSINYGERLKNIHCLFTHDRSGARSFSEERVYVVFAVTVVAEKDGLLQTATEVAGALRGLEADERGFR